MKDEKVIKKLMNTPVVRNIGLKEEMISSLLSVYDKLLIEELIETGHIELDNGMNIEIVQLIDRVHVLRGVSYHSNRRYKLKLTMEDSLYTRIEEYYNNLKKEIE